MRNDINIRIHHEPPYLPDGWPLRPLSQAAACRCQRGVLYHWRGFLPSCRWSTILAASAETKAEDTNRSPSGGVLFFNTQLGTQGSINTTIISVHTVFMVASRHADHFSRNRAAC